MQLRHLAAIAALGSLANAQSTVQLALGSPHAIAMRAPIAGPGLAATKTGSSIAQASSWTQMSSPGGLYIEDLDMATPSVGFAAAELGVILRTQDGGLTWQTIQSLGFPYYWYGIDALDAQNVVAAGFQNQSGEGIIEWSHDGGNTWQPIQSIGDASIPLRWLWRIQFVDGDRALVEAAWIGGVHTTTNGGRTSADWTYSHPTQNWLMGSLTYLADGRIWISGYDQITSPNFGATWNLSNGSNAVFDGPIDVRPNGTGIVGGGSISPTVAGWLYRTTDGAQTWTPNPVQNVAYPIRAVLAHDDQRFWAAGGNVYSNAGGIWASADGGVTWNLDQNIGNEVRDLAEVRIDANDVALFAAGYGGIWRTTIVDALGSPATNYCFCSSNAPCGNLDATGGCVNGSGQGALLSASGTASLALDDLTLTATHVPTNVFGIVFMGPNATSLPFGNGLLCIGASGLKRFSVHNSGASGSFAQGPGIASYTHAHFGFSSWLSAGQDWRFQAWFRDNAGPCGGSSNFSNATEVAFVP